MGDNRLACSLSIPKRPHEATEITPKGRDKLSDVGCSWGRWSIAPAKKGFSVVGIDSSLGAEPGFGNLHVKLQHLPERTGGGAERLRAGPSHRPSPLQPLPSRRSRKHSPTTPSRRSTGGGFAPTTRSSASCARSGGARVSWARAKDSGHYPHRRLRSRHAPYRQRVVSSPSRKAFDSSNRGSGEEDADAPRTKPMSG
jgi:hypothetical protein